MDETTSIGEIAHGVRRIIEVSPRFGGVYRILYRLPGRPMEYISVIPGETLEIGQSVHIFPGTVLPEPAQGPVFVSALADVDGLVVTFDRPVTTAVASLFHLFAGGVEVDLNSATSASGDVNKVRINYADGHPGSLAALTVVIEAGAVTSIASMAQIAAVSSRSVTNSIPPAIELVSASINGDQVTFVFDQATNLDFGGGSNSVRIKRNGVGSIVCTYVSGTGTDTVLFTSATAAVYGDTVTFTTFGGLFESAADPSAHYAASLYPVTNATPEPPAVTTISSNTAGDKVTFNFDPAYDTLLGTAGYFVVSDRTVVGIYDQTSTSITVTVSPAIQFGDVVTADVSAAVVELTGAGTSPAVFNQTVTNNAVERPALTAAASSVDGSTVEITVSPPFTSLSGMPTVTSAISFSGGLMVASVDTSDSSKLVVSLTSNITYGQEVLLTVLADAVLNGPLGNLAVTDLVVTNNLPVTAGMVSVNPMYDPVWEDAGGPRPTLRTEGINTIFVFSEADPGVGWTRIVECRTRTYDDLDGAETIGYRWSDPFELSSGVGCGRVVYSEGVTETSSQGAVYRVALVALDDRITGEWCLADGSLAAAGSPNDPGIGHSSVVVSLNAPATPTDTGTNMAKDESGTGEVILYAGFNCGSPIGSFTTFWDATFNLYVNGLESLADTSVGIDGSGNIVFTQGTSNGGGESIEVNVQVIRAYYLQVGGTAAPVGSSSTVYTYIDISPEIVLSSATAPDAIDSIVNLFFDSPVSVGYASYCSVYDSNLGTLTGDYADPVVTAPDTQWVLTLANPYDTGSTLTLDTAFVGAFTDPYDSLPVVTALPVSRY